MTETEALIRQLLEKKTFIQSSLDFNKSGVEPIVKKVELSRYERLKLQREVRLSEIKTACLEDVKSTLPYLLSHQHEDVVKAERWLYELGNKAILYTNSTGTGKTLCGGGILYRHRQDTLIVVPTDKKCLDWIEELKLLGLKVYQLGSIKDKGKKGINVTTYANFRQNEGIQRRGWNMVVYDECHNIMQNEQGKETFCLQAHRKATNHITFVRENAEFNICGEPPKAEKALMAFQRAIQLKSYEINREIERLKYLTKVIFLSATPFSYHKNLEYADGYLFDMGEDKRIEDLPSEKDLFFMDNFGYRFEKGKLLEPDASVDVNTLEREFADKLLSSGAMSTRKISLNYDYSREFVLLSNNNIGQKIDSGYSLMMNTTDINFSLLHEVLPLKFDYLYTTQLLECIKAKLVIPRIQQHLDLNRKIILFHSYNHSLPSHPFDFPYELYHKLPNSQRIRAQISLFHQLHPEYGELDLHDLDNPIRTIKKAFGSRVGVYNGDVTKKERDYIIRKFNEDDSYKDILVIQRQAGKEGISLHDTTGVHQRVTGNLDLPNRPPDLPQGEGRTYREGLMSDAIYENYVLHTNFEKLAFAHKISQRVRTAENLAVGSQARNLEHSIKEGYLNPNSNPPSKEQGKGGKLADMKLDTDTEFEKAKKSYAKSLERGNKGIPEPIGRMMVKWLDAKATDKLLDPFAGNGEIGRYFPEYTVNHYLEEDLEKRANLSINVEKSDKILSTNFDDYSLQNKYYGIASNVPSKRHTEKLFNHLKDTGRLVLFAKGIDKLIQNRSEAVMRMEIYLPAMLGYRKIVVIDKVVKPEVRFGLSQMFPEHSSYNLIGVEDMDKLFEELNKIEAPKRLKSEKS